MYSFFNGSFQFFFFHFINQFFSSLAYISISNTFFYVIVLCFK